MRENAIKELGFLKAMGIIIPQNNRDQLPAFNYENHSRCNIIKTGVKVRVATWGACYALTYGNG